MHVDVEYLGGPLDGRRDRALLGPDQLPGALRILAVEEKYTSAFDVKPSVPAEAHRYNRNGDRPANDGIWRYTWAGALH